MLDLNTIALLNREAHKALTPLDALDFIIHSLTVARRVIDNGGRRYTHAVEAAMLHDLVEDCRPSGMTEKEYADSLPIREEVKNIVLALTRRRGEQYFMYIPRVKQSGLVAVLIKKCDLMTNIARCQGDPTRESLVQRYYKALDILNEE